MDSCGRGYPARKRGDPVRKVILLFVVFFVLVQTAQAGLSVSSGSCRIKDLEGTATVTLTLKTTGNESMTVYAPSLPSPEKGITLTALDRYPISLSGSTNVRIEVRITKAVSRGTYRATVYFGDSTGTITINADRSVPAHLAPLQNIDAGKIVFDKPRKEMEKTGFKVEKKFEIVNDGDETMVVKSAAAYGTPDAGMTFNVNYPSQILNRSAETATLTITIPASAPEGTHQGKLRIDCGKAGTQTITVTVTVEHAVKFEMSAYNPDFGRVDILKSVPLKISLNESLGYKDISSVKIRRDDDQPGNGKDDWMSVDLPASIIPKGGSVPLTFTLRFRGETEVGKTYRWKYYLSNSAGNATITLQAVATPIDIAETKNVLQTMRGSKNPEVSNIAGKVLGMLSSSGAGGAEAWASVASISQSSVTFLDAMDRVVQEVDNNDHEGALNDLLVARIAVETMRKSAHTPSQTNIYTISNNFINSILYKESAYFEKMASDASDDRTKIIAQRHAATVYELLNDIKKSKKAREMAAESISAYNQKIESANNNQVDADDAIRRASDDLYRWGDAKLLVNPFVYDSTSYRYKFAINATTVAAENYQAAGEFELHNMSALRANELQKQWLLLSSQFFMLMIGYILLFAGAVIWCVLAFMTFTADSREEEFGDVVLLS